MSADNITPNEEVVDVVQTTPTPIEETPTSIESREDSVFVNEDGSQKEFNLEALFLRYQHEPETLIIEDRYTLTNFKVKANIQLNEIDFQTLSRYYFKYIDRVRVEWKGRPAQCRPIIGFKNVVLAAVSGEILQDESNRELLLQIYVPELDKSFMVHNENGFAFDALAWNKGDATKIKYAPANLYSDFDVLRETWSQFWKREPKQNINDAVRRIIGGTKQGKKNVEFRNKKSK